MASTPHLRPATPVKLFLGVTTSADGRIPQEAEQLIFKNGAIDHRSILIPMEGSIHCTFFSFQRLVETEAIAAMKQLSDEMPAGFVDNRRVVVLQTAAAPHRFVIANDMFGEEIMTFHGGGVQFLPWTPPGYRSQQCQEFFLAMRASYRRQLRSMCLMKR